MHRTARRFSRRGRHTVAAYLFLLPAIAFFLTFYFYPILLELWASLFRGQPLIGESTFAGIGNYVDALQDARVRHSFIVTLAFAFGATAATIVVGLGLAAILNGPIKARTAVRAVIFFPYIISYVIVALMWQSILDPYTGILNSVLFGLGMPGQDWLSDPRAALATLIGITVWKDAGYAMLIYLAGLQSIPSNLYEAAALDGASSGQQFRRITLPLLAPTTLFIAVVSMISHLQEFAPAYLITKGGPADATRLFSLHVFEVAFNELNLGYAAALSFLMFLVILAITGLTFRLVNREIAY